VLDFVHRMETRDGTKASLRQAGVLIAEICGLDLPAETPRAKALGSPRTGLHPAARGEGPSTPVNAPQGAPGGQEWATGEGREIKPNKPLGFALTLDASHPYLKERGLTPELVATFGLGFCSKGSMAGRICIPIHNADGALVAYAGRWVGPEVHPADRPGRRANGDSSPWPECPDRSAKRPFSAKKVAHGTMSCSVGPRLGRWSGFLGAPRRSAATAIGASRFAQSP
jgi:hypothetical protein